MTPIIGGLLIVAAIAAVVDWAAIRAGGPRGSAVERIAKPAVLVALIAAAILWPAEPGSPAAAVRPWLLIGLVASLVGDLLLLPPGRFVPGLAAFLVAHVAYLAGFALGGVTLNWVMIGAISATAVAWIVGVPLARAAGRTGLGAPVALYMAAILAMAAVATGTREPAAIAGAWLFVASDALLGWDRFIGSRRGTGPEAPPRDDRRLRIAIMVSYHLAQVLILVALAS